MILYTIRAVGKERLAVYYRIKKIIIYFSKRQKITRRDAYASHASFYAILSFVPLLMLARMILHFVAPQGVQSVTEFIRFHLPEQIGAYLPTDLVENAISSSLSVASLTVLAMLWSSSKGIEALAGGIRSVYGVKNEPNILKRRAMELGFTMVLLALFVLALILLVFGETILHLFERLGGDYQRMMRITVRVAPYIAFGLFAAVFALIYKIISREKGSFIAHMPGAFFASGGWILYSAALSFYLTNFLPEKYILYGSMGALILLMLWVRALMTILLFGAELNVYLLSHPRKVSMPKEDGKASEEQGMQ